eukprot:3625033-Lingulodinium_polyedra.AAC.1
MINVAEAPLASSEAIHPDTFVAAQLEELASRVVDEDDYADEEAGEDDQPLGPAQMAAMVLDMGAAAPTPADFADAYTAQELGDMLAERLLPQPPDHQCMDIQSDFHTLADQWLTSSLAGDAEFVNRGLAMR